MGLSNDLGKRIMMAEEQRGKSEGDKGKDVCSWPVSAACLCWVGLDCLCIRNYFKDSMGDLVDFYFEMIQNKLIQIDFNTCSFCLRKKKTSKNIMTKLVLKATIFIYFLVLRS